MKTKNKIAILTQPLGHNYGGIIQNYALRKVLVDLGHNVVTINRIADNPHSKIKIQASRLKSYLLSKIKPKNPKHFDDKTLQYNNIKFLDEHNNLSPKLESTLSLTQYFKNEKFDVVIVGSDQVWRPKYSPNIYNFFLDFLINNDNFKKIAYAASFGTDEWEYSEKQAKIVSEQIQQFDAISVRENSGILLCDKYLNRKDVVHVLDPTLLLNSQQYNQLIGKNKKKSGLFTYILDSSNIKEKFIKDCSTYLNMEVFNNQVKYYKHAPQTSNIEDYIIPPLEGWLQGFRDADFIITDSFHGTVFSIIFNKPFLTLVNIERGSSRFESLLNKLGLQNRLVYDIDNFDNGLLKIDIDYTSVNLKLDQLKSESLNYLKKHL